MLYRLIIAKKSTDDQLAAVEAVSKTALANTLLQCCIGYRQSNDACQTFRLGQRRHAALRGGRR